MRRFAARGFTLVELLVVISIIGMLIGMLLPAVQSARESGRRAQCQNNVKQIAMAFLSHESAQGFLPTGGWGVTWAGSSGSAWIGDPSQGFSNQQPGGWGFNILPDIDQGGLYRSQYLPSSSSMMSAGTLAAQATFVVGTPLSIYNCPSRRRLGTGPNAENITYLLSGGTNCTPTQVFRGDYAANMGSSITSGSVSSCYYNTKGCPSSESAVANWTNAQWTSTYDNGNIYNGVVFRHSQVTMASITDGASSTYMVGEKYLNPANYSTGIDTTDNMCSLVGFDANVVRQGDPPQQDRSGVIPQNLSNPQYPFGSAHSNGFNMGFCDGSVHQISYSINPQTHQCLCNRHDGQAVDLTTVLK